MKKDSTAYSAERPAWDKDDCSVRALAVATGMPYGVASIAFSALGRQLKKGTATSLSTKLHEDFLKMTPIYSSAGMRLDTFLGIAKTGSFVVHKSKHAFAVVEGVVHDWEGTTSPATIVVRAWKVTEQTRGKMEGLRKLFE